MRSKLVLSLIVVLLVVFGTSSLTLSNRNKANTGQDQAKPDLSHFPLVDYEAVLRSDPNDDPRRQKKSKKYNKKHAAPISESLNGIFVHSEWDRGLPALPISRSAVILIGQITDAKAYLSEDKGDIYSEFTIRVDDILKNDLKSPLTPGSVIAAERQGGRVRFASGKIMTAQVSHQDMPRTGRRYVLFLGYDPTSESDVGDFYIVTGYEIRASRIQPLDDFSAKNRAYKDVPEDTFLFDLRAAIINGQ